MINKLRLYREHRSMSQAELADAAGISLTTVYFIERGTASPSGQTMLLLSEALQVPAVYIFPELGIIKNKKDGKCK